MMFFGLAIVSGEPTAMLTLVEVTVGLHFVHGAERKAAFGTAFIDLPVFPK